jgi:hypothetical protein
MNSNVIENEIIENKIYHTKLNTKFKRIWKWNSNEIENKIQINLKIKFKRNWKGNSIPNEIQIASCMRA